MNKILNDIKQHCELGKKCLAILIDPDKVIMAYLGLIIRRVHESPATHILVGGSEVELHKTEQVIEYIKQRSELPVLIFPGDVNQISSFADALLFLCLISGRNPEYLIGKHVDSARRLKQMNLDVIPTSYILIGENNKSAVEKVTATKPIPLSQIGLIVDTAIAGELLGHQLVYLEAGSGASDSVPSSIISEVKKHISIPLIVGGGIRSENEIECAFKNGADMVVVGTAFERNFDFFRNSGNTIKQKIE